MGLDRLENQLGECTCFLDILLGDNFIPNGVIDGRVLENAPFSGRYNREMVNDQLQLSQKYVTFNDAVTEAHSLFVNPINFLIRTRRNQTFN